ncbi:MAG TPA: ABC transporter ATP-binding protein [Syntrophobacteraceae bacterium]|nr:ABC transporter ATP-binding protein [Syntrophobacteraceae bacterium]
MITKKPLSYWVRTSNLKLQILLLIVILLTVVARVFPLEMQKNIINSAIRFRRLDLLYLYCGLYLGAVVLASGLKYVINTIQTYLGQQALARMRKDFYAHIMTLPLNFFRKASSGLVVSALVTELANAAEFVGTAVAVPVTNLLTLLAFAGYMFYLNPLLAALSIAIYPLVALVVPKLQGKANQANKERVDITRSLSGKIGETITGIHEVHGNGSFVIENRKYGEFVDQLFKVRVIWNLYRFGIKVINNLFQNLGPFILFIVGGYLAINGRFDLGALVAFLSAYEKLYDPWRELMDFYQVYQDAKVSYRQTVDYFDVSPEFQLQPVDRQPVDLQGAVQVKDLSFSVAGGIQLLKQINVDLNPGEQLALVGHSGSGKSTLAQCIAQLYPYTGGSVTLDGYEVANLTKQDIARNVGIVSQSPYIFDGTIKENLLYSCNAVLETDGSPPPISLPTLDEMIESIQQVGLFVDVLRFGLNTLLPAQQEELISKLIRIRQNFQEEYGEELADYVEFFDERRYLHYSPIAVNLTFGQPIEKEFLPEHLPNNQYFLDFLDQAHLTKPLIHVGWELASQVIDILGMVTPDEVFFQQSPISADDFEDYRELVARVGEAGLLQISDADRFRLLKLALDFVPGVHKVVALPELLERLLLEGRMLFRTMILRDQPHAYSFYQRSEYIHSSTILDNILFGKPRTDQPKGQDKDKISQSIIQLLIEEDMLEQILEIGMEFRVGTKGDRMSGGQRQKLAIARTFLKQPRILIMDEATSALDNASQQRIQNVLELKWRGASTLIAVAHRLDTVRNFDKIAVMKVGKILEMGTYQELLTKRGLFYELVHGTKTSGQ